jgi:hypothetical protein
MWKTDPLLAALPQMHDLHAIASSSNTLHTSNNRTRDNSRRGEHNPIEAWINDYELNAWEPPKLIVAVEFDYWGPHADKTWTEIGYSRGFQIVQVSRRCRPQF